MAPLLSMLLMLAAPPLTEAQRLQLEMARDGHPGWDEPALYPLFKNALEWQPGDESGAAVPDYAALHRDPAEHRGKVFLIEGVLGGAPQVMRQRLQRPGDWEENLQQWGVLVNRQPDEVVVLMLLDPMPANQLPTQGGDKVRAAARFFKVWKFVDREGVPTDYLLFVGRSIRVESGGSRVTTGSGSGPGSFSVVFLLFLAAAAAWYALRRATKLSLKPRPLKSRPGIIGETMEEAEEEQDGTLPEDPAEALKALERRGEET